MQLETYISPTYISVPFFISFKKWTSGHESGHLQKSKVDTKWTSLLKNESKSGQVDMRKWTVHFLKVDKWTWLKGARGGKQIVVTAEGDKPAFARNSTRDRASDDYAGFAATELEVLRGRRSPWRSGGCVCGHEVRSEREGETEGAIHSP